MKQGLLFLSLLLGMCMLMGCMGVPVVYHGAPVRPQEGTTAPSTESTSDTAESGSTAWQTGIVLISDTADSSSAAETEAGAGQYDVMVAAVLVDAEGVIRDCILDGIAATVSFDRTGTITTDLEEPVLSKNELGSDYGMVKWGGAIAEWSAQAAALAEFAVGKTAAELRVGGIDETGYAPAGSDLATSATIYLGGYVSAIEAAVAAATYQGAVSGDRLALQTQSSVSGSYSAAAGENGCAQLEVAAAAITVRAAAVTSCVLERVAAQVRFDARGMLTDAAVPAA